MIGLRLYIRVYRRGSIFAWKTWNPADVVMIFAWFGFFSQILVDTILLHKYRYPIITEMYTDHEIIEVGKVCKVLKSFNGVLVHFANEYIIIFRLSITLKRPTGSFYILFASLSSSFSQNSFPELSTRHG